MSNRLVRSRLRACQFKEKLDLTNAQEYLLAAQKSPDRYRNPEALELYMCPCGSLHIGHAKGTKHGRS